MDPVTPFVPFFAGSQPIADEEWIAAFTLPLGLAGIPVGGRKS